MKIVTTHISRYIICAMFFAIFVSCKKSSTNETFTKIGREKYHNIGNYKPQAGDRVKLTGVFKTTKGYMGVVTGVLLPEFCNKKKESLKYKDKWVKVIGTVYKPVYLEQDGRDVQKFLGLQIKLESIEIVKNTKDKQEKVEKLSCNKGNVQ